MDLGYGSKFAGDFPLVNGEDRIEIGSDGPALFNFKDTSAHYFFNFFREFF